MRQQMKLQDVLFPVEEKYAPQFNLYYTGAEREIKPDGSVMVQRGEILNCSTYFNALSICKWKEYSNVKRYGLKLRIKGEFTVQLMGYGKRNLEGQDEYNADPLELQEAVLDTKEFSLSEAEDIEFYYPENDFLLVSFMIIAHDTTHLLKGYYVGEAEKEDVRDVCLSLATTTFKKEDFIIPNIAQLKKSILESDDEMAENFYVHVVDNGRTLSPEQIEGEHVFLHPNPNVGGSGGFARGMIETMRQEKKATHVLLMDDDVLIQPESLRRTYRLLKVLKEEYKNRFISGAMLYYEKMHLQHEDVGYVSVDDGSYGPVKWRWNLYKMEDCCRNELPWEERKYQYCGWWYCCIPMQYVREDNLPLPFFVRGDDVEYSLRNRAEFITMNGICVWHMGFTQKFNAMMELYQVHRNSLMLQAISGVCGGIDFAERMKGFTRTELLRFNYDSAELILDAMDDYMKGPHFLDEPKGEDIIKEKGKKNEKLVDLSEFPDVEVDLKHIYWDEPCSGKKLWMYRLSYNGLYLPDSMLDDKPVAIPYDWFYARGRQALKTHLLAVNPHTKQGNMRILDRKRAKKLKKRAKKTYKAYYANREGLEREYAAEMKRFTSIEFWEKYLGI
ncbi:MAG: glycosyltransferase [Bacteroidales bacterium]|nr:glycosyltransferase [Bacteroidales bacterium]